MPCAVLVSVSLAPGISDTLGSVTIPPTEPKTAAHTATPQKMTVRRILIQRVLLRSYHALQLIISTAMPFAKLIARLKKHYGEPQLPPARGPFELILWENACYLLPDERRAVV